MTAFDWTDVLGHDTFVDDHYTLADADPTIDVVSKLMPAVEQPGRSTTVQSVAEMVTTGGSHNVWDLRLTGSVPGTSLALHNMSGGAVIPHFGPVLPVAQGGTDTPNISPVSGPLSAVVRGDRLVVTSTESCTPTGDSQLRACGRVIDLDVSTNPTTRRQDFYIAQKNRSIYAPAAAFAQDGNLFLTFTRSSLTEMPSSYVARQAPADPAGSLSAFARLMAGTSWWNVGWWVRSIGMATDPQVADSAWASNLAATQTNDYSYRTAQLTTATGDTYIPITPLRVVDSRTGPVGAFYNGVPKAFDVAGMGTIPANAVAITGNLTVVNPQTGGYVSVGPTVSANPTTSTINFAQYQERANNVTLPLNADGGLMAVFKGGGGADRFTDMILDISGYFLADDNGATYTPVTSSRVLDSRVGTGLAGRFQVNVPRTFAVTGVPPGAKAVTGNLTVVGPTKRGYVSLTPNPQANPTTSTINFPVADTIANGVTVQLSDTGTLSAVFKASGGSTDLIFDVTGYYLDDLTGLRFYPLNPGRIMDTRFNTLTQLFGPFSSSTPRTLVTGGHFGVPANALAVTGSLTVVGQTKAGYVSITKSPDATPPVSTINFPVGDVRANGVTVPLNAANDMALVYKASSGAKTHLILDLTGYFK
jgi:hypothetical protein